MTSARTRKRGGFSLLELLAVVTIIAVIAVIVIPRAVNSRDAAKAAVDAQNRAIINRTVERYYRENESWPTDLATLAADKDYFPEGVPNNPVTGNPYTLNADHRVQ